jgi:hypothetical protein
MTTLGTSDNGSAVSTQASTASIPAAPAAPDEMDADDKTLLGPPINWSPEIVKAIHRAVFEETTRVGVTPQFLPHALVPPKTKAVPLNLVTPQQLDGSGLPAGTPLMTPTIDPGLTIRMVPLAVDFALTDEQVAEISEAGNPESTSAFALVRQVAKYHALATDLLVAQGALAYSSSFFTNYVSYPAGQIPLDGGLMGGSFPSGSTTYQPYQSTNSTAGQTLVNPYQYASAYAGLSPSITTPISVTPLGITGVIWGDKTLAAVVQAIGYMVANGLPPPYALLLDSAVYADLFAPTGPESLAITADRVSPLC